MVESLYTGAEAHVPLMINWLRGATGEAHPPVISRTVVAMKAFPGSPVHPLSLCWVSALCREGLVVSLRYKVLMRELLIDAAERAIRYLEGLDGRRVAPDPGVVTVLQSLISRCPIIPTGLMKPWRCSTPTVQQPWQWPGHASLAS